MATYTKPLGTALVVIAVCAGGFYLYLDQAFPKVRCEGAVKHLNAPEGFADCVDCHTKTSPQVVADWYESKHGVLLVKCAVCHGEPDGSSGHAFTKSPDPAVICASCHDPALKGMQAKYGMKAECNTCHPHHQNSMHSKAFETKQQSGKTSL